MRPTRFASLQTMVMGNLARRSRKAAVLAGVVRLRRSAAARLLGTSDGHRGGARTSPPFVTRAKTASVLAVGSSAKNQARGMEAGRQNGGAGGHGPADTRR